MGVSRWSQLDPGDLGGYGIRKSMNDAFVELAVLVVVEPLEERAAHPLATPPMTWPSTTIGLMTLPQSWTHT